MGTMWRSDNIEVIEDDDAGRFEYRVHSCIEEHSMKISNTSILKRTTRDKNNNEIEKPYFVAILIKDNELQKKERRLE